PAALYSRAPVQNRGQCVSRAPRRGARRTWPVVGDPAWGDDRPRSREFRSRSRARIPRRRCRRPSSRRFARRMTATRRLAAILAADVAGYSRLMEADEESTLAALRAIRGELGDPKIAAHKGRIVKTTGDGLLV